MRFSLWQFEDVFLSYITPFFACFSSYGFLNRFRPEPLMPNQIYRFDPVTHRVRVVATGFNKCNGIALSEDGKLAYMYVSPFQSLHLGLRRGCESFRSDTAAAGGFLGNNQTDPATMQVQVYSVFFLVYLNLTISLSPTTSGPL